MNPHYTDEELHELGVRFGRNVKVSRKASFYGTSKISLGHHVRIDDFCVLSAGEGGISIGNRVHIAAYSSLVGKALIALEDYSGLSSRVSIYSSSDDYSGEWMTNPTVPIELTNVKHADVYVGRHVIIGSGTVVLPGVTFEEGVAIGALSLVTRNCAAFGIYAGSPARRIAERSRKLLELEREIAPEGSIG